MPAATSSVASSGSAGNRRPPSAPRRSSSGSPESTLTLRPAAFNAAHASSRCGNGVPGQAAEIDHVGAVGPQRCRARRQRIERERRRVDDLGEDADVVARQIGWRGAQRRRTPAGRSARPARARKARRIPPSAPREIEPGAAGERRRGRRRAGAAGGASMIGLVISAATFTPMSTTVPVEAARSTSQPAAARGAAAARWPVRKSRRSAIARVGPCRARQRGAAVRSSEIDDARRSNSPSNSVLARSMRRGYTLTSRPAPRSQFGRGVAGEHDRGNAAFAGLGEDVGGQRVGYAETHLATVFDVAGATTSVWYSPLELPDRRRRSRSCRGTCARRSGSSRFCLYIRTTSAAARLTNRSTCSRLADQPQAFGEEMPGACQRPAPARRDGRGHISAPAGRAAGPPRGPRPAGHPARRRTPRRKTPRRGQRRPRPAGPPG